MARITSIAPAGNWNGMYKFTVVLDNGQSGTAYSRQPTLRFNIGDEVTATLNEKGSMKLDAPGYAGQQPGYQNNQQSYQQNGYTNQAVPTISKDELIVRQVAIKCAVELGAAQGMDLMQIIRTAEVLNDWVNMRQKGKTYEEHFTQDEDPFVN
jgi:hypothetical protein